MTDDDSNPLDDIDTSPPDSGELRNKHGGLTIKWEEPTVGAGGVITVYAPASGPQTMTPEEARETAQALRDGGEPLNRLFQDEDVLAAADDLEQAADELEPYLDD